jgi:hypothetical protein
MRRFNLTIVVFVSVCCACTTMPEKTSNTAAQPVAFTAARPDGPDDDVDFIELDDPPIDASEAGQMCNILNGSGSACLACCEAAAVTHGFHPVGSWYDECSDQCPNDDGDGDSISVPPQEQFDSVVVWAITGAAAAGTTPIMIRVLSQVLGYRKLDCELRVIKVCMARTKPGPTQEAQCAGLAVTACASVPDL